MPRPGLHLALALAAVALAGGCKDRRRATPAAPVPIAALRAIPADAAAVVGLDVERLARSRLVARAVDQMFDRSPEVRDRLTALAATCQLDLPTQVKTVHLALGPPVTTGARASILVATGELTETNLTRCLQAGVGAGGGEVTVRQTGERTLYRLVAGRRELFFGFGDADTVVLGPREDWVLAGLGAGRKVEASPVLGPALATVDRQAAMWAVATVDPELGMALTRLSKGAIAAGPTVVVGTLDPLDGVRATAMFSMTSASDARALAEYARGELAMGTIAARALGLSKVLTKVVADHEGTVVRLRVALTDAEVKDVLAAIDRGRAPGQDAQPAADAGAGTPLTPTPGSTPPTAIDAGDDAR
jgi:hypothetical protein